MKINYFSPLPPTKSGISEVAALIVPALSQYSEVTVWTDQDEWNRDLESYASIRQYQSNEMDWRELNKADFTIYHIGNNIDYHRQILIVSQQLSGMVVLHDIILSDLFRAFYNDESSNPTDQKFIHKVVNGSTTTKWAIDNACGVLVHSRGAFTELAQHQRWLLGYQPLAYPSIPLLSTSSVKLTPPYRLIIFGHIGYNRRVESVLKAIDEMPNKDQLQLDIYGGIDDENTLRQQIEQRKLKSIVTVHGFATDEILDRALSKAHLAINLRYPTMGEASLSQLRIWQHALPSIVTQVGWYEEQSEDAVLFVRQEHEIEDIKRHLHRLVDDPESLVAMGKCGREILEENHSPDAYAKALIEFAKELPIGYQALTSQYLVRRVGKEMARWQMPELGSQELSGVAAAMHFLSQ
jgi:glycosyltransferase involved in cell wall biosynthesis